MSSPEDSLYLELATVLALRTFSSCVSGPEEDACVWHYNSNRHEIPPDILARLGVMRLCSPDQWLGSVAHFFPNQWRPGQSLDFQRHPGEPSIFDLIAAVCFLVDWDSTGNRELEDLEVPPISEFPKLDLSDEWRFLSDPQLTFEGYVFRMQTMLLERLGLGLWNADRSFELIYPLQGEKPIDLADTYRGTRTLTAMRLGGVEFLFPPNERTFDYLSVDVDPIRFR